MCHFHLHIYYIIIMTECQDNNGVTIKWTLNFKLHQNEPTLSGVNPVHVFSPSSRSPIFVCFCFDLATTTGTAITLAVFVIDKYVCVYVCGVCVSLSHPPFSPLASQFYTVFLLVIFSLQCIFLTLGQKTLQIHRKGTN